MFKERQVNVHYVDDWFLMSSPIPVICIWIAYMLFVLKLGPNYMKNRPEFNFRKTIFVYNSLQVVLSSYMVFEGLDVLKPVNYIFTPCTNDEEVIKKMTNGMHLYFLAKLSELLDTVFFVLRKKYNQVTFLHVYHHSLMLLIVWLLLKFEPSGNTIFLRTTNSFVHVFMYAYYALSTFPSLQKYLWWKKYITILQLAQFSIVTIYAIGNTAISRCKFSIFLLSTVIINSFIFMYLFGKFYYNSFKVPKGKHDKTITNRADKDNDMNSISNRTKFDHLN